MFVVLSGVGIVVGEYLAIKKEFKDVKNETVNNN